MRRHHNRAAAQVVWAGMTDWVEARGRETTEKLRDKNDEKGKRESSQRPSGPE